MKHCDPFRAGVGCDRNAAHPPHDLVVQQRHELRVGELARLGEIPHTPYYGSIDATPLFLILLAEHAAWTGSLELFNDLRENIERAINWMDQYGGLKDGGYLSYKSKTDKGIVNQGWKDSGNGIVTM